jgi:hypothetical protein
MNRSILLWALGAMLLACGGAPAAPEAPAAAVAPPFEKDPLLTEPLYRTGKLFPEYAGEEVAGQVFETAVVYLDEAAREPYRVFVRDGKLVDGDGRPLNPDGTLGPNGNDTAIWVMDAAGNLYVGFEQRKGVFHHSSFLAGGPVSAAGELVVIDGELIEISNRSGHYRPPPFTLDQTIEHLEGLGLETGETKRSTVGVDL